MILLAFLSGAHAHQGQMKRVEIVNCHERACIRMKSDQVNVSVDGRTFAAESMTIEFVRSGGKVQRQIEVSDAAYFMDQDLLTWDGGYIDLRAEFPD